MADRVVTGPGSSDLVSVSYWKKDFDAGRRILRTLRAIAATTNRAARATGALAENFGMMPARVIARAHAGMMHPRTSTNL